MGNCIVLQEKVVKVMKTNGKVLEYKPLVKKDNEVLPLVQEPPTKVPVKKKVTFAEEVEESSKKGSDQVLRIKLVISKKELQALLSEGGGLTVDGMVQYPLQKEHNSNIEIIKSDEFTDDDNDHCIRWKPALDSIPELY
ncbi:uncharacterized protein LOC107809955 [Nicotiana tabacum]|uniref:Uncharacterized protein LOC107809955 n=1 Tax=Nicotiana tabacum TaxID=4097 RepID=A0A1S4BMT0_TOBAC|nr:uncharacterized protein LOC104118045 [Nicotiana tomentosiformis]XP_016490147.1 PREDICTED: uncharacterized protein LOC107809955 [Nicotiana tabacum]